MTKIAILYICTGKYYVFWKEFFESCEEYFCTQSEKHYFVFTDCKQIYKENDCSRIHKIFQKNLGWPDNTLQRFHFFLTQEKELRQFNYTFFFNANIIFLANITEDEFLPKNNLLVAQHPGYYDKTNLEFTYDRNPKSTAYIEQGDGMYYVQGALEGGKTECFLELCSVLKKNIDIDEGNHIVALWHDESHLNRYIIGRNDFTLLSPAYLYPEGWDMPFSQKIMQLDKSKYFDVAKIKRKKKQHFQLRENKIWAMVKKWLDTN
ncbi:MAG: hypothetical protein Ta2A_17710 [Treponemataceae bacterium]|nr:MAG: hypothetical protein Ta2A_17710 [Treponemataceae bacterium]